MVFTFSTWQKSWQNISFPSVFTYLHNHLGPMLEDRFYHANVFRTQQSNSELGGSKVAGKIPKTEPNPAAL